MKITIYELLGMVKDDKAPKKIKYVNSIWEYDKETKDYFHNDLWLFYSMNSIGLIEREVEILEKPKGIPEKIEIYEDEEGHYFIDKHCKKIYITCDEVNFMVEEFNQLLDYLKSKGE